MEAMVMAEMTTRETIIDVATTIGYVNQSGYCMIVCCVAKMY